MTVLNVGILAIVAAFNSGAVSLVRASSIANATAAHQQVVGADSHQYWMDTYIKVTTVTGGEPVKQVTVVVRDPNDTTNVRALVRESSTFDYYTAPDTG